MISFWISVVTLTGGTTEDRLGAAELPELTIAAKTVILLPHSRSMLDLRKQSASPSTRTLPG